VTFKDHFSEQATDYAKYRPNYPQELFAYVTSLATSREDAWDCATGNGQAAVGLAEFFERVIATDASAKQILSAEQNARVQYRVAPAEKSGLSSGSMDLITVAQALHWFDLDAFYMEAKRVLKSRGVLAVWCYNLLEIAPEVDAIVNRFYRETVGPYWPIERKVIEDHYQTILFPFDELHSPVLAMKAHWSLAQLVGYLRTWSATQAFIAANRSDPIEPIISDLSAAGRNPNWQRLVSWPLTIRAGHLIP
jgi:ubiquinone/menaquinone biosynthesis C-methylase UbiE